MTEITSDEKLAAFGLFALAKEHYGKAREYEAALKRRLGVGKDGLSGDWLSDAIYDDEPMSSIGFDEALASEGVTVAPTAPEEPTP